MRLGLSLRKLPVFSCFSDRGAASFVVWLLPAGRDAETSIRIVWEAEDWAPACSRPDEALGNHCQLRGGPPGRGHARRADRRAPPRHPISTLAGGETTEMALDTTARRFRSGLHVCHHERTCRRAAADIFDEVTHQGVLDHFGGITFDEIALVLIPGDLVVNGNSYGQGQRLLHPVPRPLLARPGLSCARQPRKQLSYYFQYFHLPENGIARLRGALVVQGLRQRPLHDCQLQRAPIFGSRAIDMARRGCLRRHVRKKSTSLSGSTTKYKSELWTLGDDHRAGERPRLCRSNAQAESTSSATPTATRAASP